MSLPNLLNLAIGLIVLYFLLSTICSIVVDLFARFIRYREELLTVTINSLITGQKDKAWNVFSLSLDRIKNQFKEYFLGGAQANLDLLLPGKKPQKDVELSPDDVFASNFWRHPEIRPLASNYQDAPTAIPAETFARAIVDLALPRDLQGKLPQSKVAFLRRLRSNKGKLPEPLCDMLLKIGASSDIPENAVGRSFWTPLYSRIEQRYEDTMRTTTDRFKGWTQKWLFLIGFSVACILNADSIQFIRLLSVNDDARAEIASYAATHLVSNESATNADKETKGSSNPPSNEEEREQIKQSLTHLKKLSAIGFPIGWNESGGNLYPFISENSIQEKPRTARETFLGLFLKLGGLLTTALAINLGAPFWYGLLSKLIGARQKAGLATPPSEPSQSADPKVARALESQNPTPLEIDRDLASPNNGFDARKAYWLAEASLLAYQNEEQIISKVTQDWFLPKPQFWSKTASGIDTQAFAFATETFALIAFRGTEPSKIKDLCTDANILQLKLASQNPNATLEVHQGFQRALEAVYSEDCDLPDKNGFSNINAFLESDAVAKVKQVYITGHSLGGALSLALAAKLALDGNAASKKAIIYNFGCPRIGDAAFAQYFDHAFPERVTRVVNEDDIVTKIPPLSPSFRHVGSMLHLQPYGRFAFDVPSVERFLDLAIEATDDVKNATRKSLADHSMETYRKRCFDLTGAQVG